MYLEFYSNGCEIQSLHTAVDWNPEEDESADRTGLDTYSALSHTSLRSLRDGSRDAWTDPTVDSDAHYTAGKRPADSPWTFHKTKLEEPRTRRVFKC